MGKIFYTSDLHFGHENVIRFDNRPFLNVQEMEEVIVKNWNDKVSNEDKVYILGDFCWGNKDEWIRILKRLKGQKFLIIGNHDHRIQFTGELKKLLIAVYDYKEIDDNGRRVIMCHYPIPFYRSNYNPNIYHLYGHVHITLENDLLKDIKKLIKEKDKRGKSANNCQFYNVGCMLWNYTPVTLDEIIEKDS